MAFPWKGRLSNSPLSIASRIRCSAIFARMSMALPSALTYPGRERSQSPSQPRVTSTLLFVLQHQCPSRRKHTPHAIDQRQFDIGHLTRATFPALLAGGFDDGEDAIHTRVGVRQTTTVGVDRQRATGGRLAVFKKVDAFTRFGKPQRPSMIGGP